MQSTKSLMLSLMLLLSSFVAVVEAKTSGVTVYASKTCGCCHQWVKHLESNGFKVKTEMVDDVSPVKKKFQIPAHMQSCHTAVVDGYLIEGHVPAMAIKKMLSQKPAIRGLAVPGMPIGSPGMEQGNYKEAYDVMSFTKQGKEAVFMKF